MSWVEKKGKGWLIFGLLYIHVSPAVVFSIKFGLRFIILFCIINVNPAINFTAQSINIMILSNH